MRSRNRSSAPAPSPVQTANLAHRKDSASSNTLSENKPSTLDGLRFKLSARGERHYFTDVRFGAEYATTSDMQTVTSLLNGQCLEEMNAEFSAALLGKSPCADELRNLIKDLQLLLCA